MYHLKPLITVSLKAQLVTLRMLYAVLFGYAFAIPTMVPYIGAHFGDTGLYFYLAALASLAGLIFNIPFGILADKHDRKRVITAGMLLYSLCWLLLCLPGPSEWPIFAVIFFIHGVSCAMCKPLISAYVHDILEAHNAGARYAKEESIRTTYGTLAMMAITLSAGYLYQFHPLLPFITNGIITLIFAGLFVLYMPSVKHLHDDNEQPLLGSPLSDIKRLLNPRQSLFWLILSGGAWFAVSDYIYFVIQARMVDLTFSVTLIAALTSGSYLFRAIGSWLTHRYLSHYALLISACCYSAILSAIALLNVTIAVILLFLTADVFRTYTTTFMTITTTTKAPAGQKSLMRSLQAFQQSLQSIIFNVVAGFAVSNYGASASLLGVAGYILLLVAVPWCVYIALTSRK